MWLLNARTKDGGSQYPTAAPISPTLSRPGTGTLKVDGKEVQTIAMEHTLPMILQWDESFDIGSDTLTGVNDADYKPPFKLTARLDKLTIKVDRPQLSPADIKKFETAMRNNKASE
jgi:arylsulfatase